MPAPKLRTRFPDASNLRIGGSIELAQLSYANAEAAGGLSGFEPHRSATQMDSPSRSIPTAFNAPHVRPAGSLPHLSVLVYGLGASFVGGCSPCVYTLPAPMAASPTTKA